MVGYPDHTTVMQSRLSKISLILHLFASQQENPSPMYDLILCELPDRLSGQGGSNDLPGHHHVLTLKVPKSRH